MIDGARYFVLRYDGPDCAAQTALRVYMALVMESNPELAHDLQIALRRAEKKVKDAKN